MKKLKYIISLLLLSLPVFVAGQSDLLITGNIYSEFDGGLIGVQLVEIDKTDRVVSSTVTDFNGNFSLQIKNSNNRLRISYVGFKTITTAIGAKRKFDIKMDESTALTEIVVTGKKLHDDGTFAIPQREISGAVQKINTSEFEGLSVASIEDALQGRIAGLDIMMGSGNLGSGSVLRIRGTSSINSNANPLIVVNDVPFENNVNSFDYAGANQEQFANLLNINPDDIEEITVLKDGASAAIWGSRGANGVIMIRTKRGAKGPTRVQYSYRFSGKQQPRGLRMLNGDDYTMMMKQAYFNPRQDEDAADILEFNYDPTFSEYENFNNNTDWVKELTQYGFSHDHTLTVSGGGDKANYRFSLGYLGETGTVIQQELDRITSRMNFDYRVSDRIRFTSEFALTHTDNKKNLSVDGGEIGDNLLGMAYKKMPNVSVYEQDANGNNTPVFYTIKQADPLRTRNLDGSQIGLLNPVALAYLALNNDKEVQVMPKFSLRYDILDPEESILRYDGYISFDYKNAYNTRFLPRETTSQNWDNDMVNRSWRSESESLNMYSSQNMTYSPKLGEKNNLMLFASWQVATSNYRNQGFERSNLASGLAVDPTLPGRDRGIGSGAGERRNMGILGRLHYTHLARYILDLSMRYDADTRFGSNQRWGSFPSAAVKWIISDESFMKPTQSWLSELGIRASYGITGNPPDGDYLYYSRYDGSWDYSSNYINMPATKPNSIRLSNLKWETSTTYNLGFDLSMLDFRYNADFNIYKKRTEDLLFKDQSIPSSSGFGSLSYINGGTMDNVGWEFNARGNVIDSRDLKLEVNLNFQNSINEIVALSPSFLNSYNTEFKYDNGSYMTRIQQGNALGSIYGFRYKGVYQYDKYVENGTSPYARDVQGNVIRDGNGNPVPMYFAYGASSAHLFRGGDAIYEDINHDGSIDELDVVYLGNSNPKLQGGFGATLRYKNFSINAFFNFRYGNKILNRGRMNAEKMYNNDNQSIAVNWRWRKDGDVTEIPRALYNYGHNWMASDRFVEDGSFVRFKYLTFNYSFDKKAIKPFFLNQLDLYLTLNNLYTFTKYTGVDPEVAPNILGISEDDNKTPRSQYFTLSITAGF